MKYQPARVQLGQGQNGGLVAWLWSQARRVGQALCRAFCCARDSRILAAMYSLSRSRGVVSVGINEPPDVQAEVEILGREAAGLDGEAEPVGVDLEEAERLLGVVGVGRFGDFGYVDQGAVGRVVLLG